MPEDYRFIPTCVGNSSRQSQVLPRIPVHPHVCGELVASTMQGVLSPGSSPRVWGTLQLWVTGAV